uniref:Uncharacterized protein n=1 Tax=Onchocerca volvulus TaxID=6282 RepID=A0A8R1TMM6_ONCVO
MTNSKLSSYSILNSLYIHTVKGYMARINKYSELMHSIQLLTINMNLCKQASELAQSLYSTSVLLLWLSTATTSIFIEMWIIFKTTNDVF